MTEGELTPSEEQVKALRDQVGPGPVIMLNLLAFKPDGGREKFAEYGALSGPLVARQGAEIFYRAEVGPAIVGEDWDVCVMVRFPDIEDFIGLAADPEYLAKAPALRAAALERTLWTVTQAPTPAG